jgi:hypothetical protein
MTAMTPAAIGSKLHVFLSYRTVEARFADALKDHLIRDFIGLVKVFLASDATSVPAGTNWHEGIIEGLRISQFHIVICSKISVQRPWINYEVGAAGVRGIPIMPLCHSGLVPEQLPVPLSLSEGGRLADEMSLRKLYVRVAELIGSAVPDVDFAGYAAEFAEIESQTKEAVSIEETCAKAAEPTASLESEQFQDPNVLCVTSPQFLALGFKNQLQVVLDAVPKALRHHMVESTADLRRVLLEEHVDIVHIAAFVCPRGGDLYFSNVELPQGASAAGEIDRIPPEALVALLERARTRLVVLGASTSLVLGAQLLPVTHVIAARDLVSPVQMASWVETFYKALTGAPLAAAFKLATDVSQAPMMLYARQGRAAR